MQIGIDLGATKIESVLLKENGLELHRDRIQSPKNYQKTISDITKIVNVGVCTYLRPTILFLMQILSF